MTIGIKRKEFRKGKGDLEGRSEESQKLGLVTECVQKKVQGICCFGCL